VCLISEEELISISSSAFLNLLLHVFRFWSKNPTGEKKVVFGVLLGYIEGDTRYIKKVAPLLHQDNRNFVMDEDFMKNVGKINKKELDSGSVNEVIGWYRSTNDGIKFTARDIKNHINFQEFNLMFIGLIIDPSLFSAENYGFSVYRLEGDKYYNMMSPHMKIPWEIEPIENPEEIIIDFRGYISNYFQNQPLITELNE